MSDRLKRIADLPPEQQAIRAKCFHPSGTFVEFNEEEIEQSIPVRFEKIARLYPDRTAVKMGDEIVTYGELNAMANRVARALVAQQRIEAEPVALLFRSARGFRSCGPRTTRRQASATNHPRRRDRDFRRVGSSCRSRNRSRYWDRDYSVRQ